MKKILIALASIAALSFIASCTKEEANSVEEQGKQITITASIPEEGLTKVGFESVATGMKLTWEAGDQITISDPSNSSNTQVYYSCIRRRNQVCNIQRNSLDPCNLL